MDVLSYTRGEMLDRLMMPSNRARMSRMARNSAILLGVFLLGLIPLLVRHVETRQELARAEAALALSQTRDLASRAYLEVTRNNFGVAAQHSSRLYDRLAELSKEAEEPVSSIARDAVNKRAEVMEMLAVADPNARTALQELTSRLLSTPESKVETRVRSRE
jgi:hypothetical protein